MEKQKTNRLEDNNFERLATQVGTEIATYCFCAYFDLKYDPDIEAKGWREYETEIRKYANNHFRDGITDINNVIEVDMTDEEMWERNWGVGDENNPYDEKDYRRLDNLYHTYSARLMKSGGMDAQQEDIIRSCCRMRLISDRCTAKGDKESIDIASKLNKMIQDNLSSENLRKKDEKPIEVAKVDGIVEAIRNKFGVGVELTYEQAVAICSQWLLSHRYPMTKDAAEQMLLAIINCTRQNNDEPELDELPERYKFSPECCEFAETSNGMELEAFNYLGIDIDK